MKNTSATSKKPEGDFDQDAGGTGTTFGAAGGAIVGGVLGSMAGPGGTVIGALAGAAAGGAVGHVIGAGGWADSNETYWQENLETQPFYEKGFGYADYAEALRLGHEQALEPSGRSFDENEELIAAEWERVKGSSRLTWDQARRAARAAWEQQAKGSG